MTTAVCFGARTVPQPPVEVRIARLEKLWGASTVPVWEVQVNSNGVYSPLFRDSFGRPIQHCSCDQARRAMWRHVRKWETDVDTICVSVEE